MSWSYLRAARDKVGGPVALVHLDAHLDTGDEYHGNKLRFFNNFLEQNDINWSLSGLTLGSMKRNFDLFTSLKWKSNDITNYIQNIPNFFVNLMVVFIFVKNL